MNEYVTPIYIASLCATNHIINRKNKIIFYAIANIELKPFLYASFLFGFVLL